MKKIKDIDQKPSHFQDDVPAETIDQMPTYRKMFRAAVGMALGRSGEESIELYQIGLKLKLDGSELSLEDAEFKILKDKCQQNPVGWSAHFHAQCLLKLKEAEAAKE